jgi:hypothetical protein
MMIWRCLSIFMFFRESRVPIFTWWIGSVSLVSSSFCQCQTKKEVVKLTTICLTWYFTWLQNNPFPCKARYVHD